MAQALRLAGEKHAYVLTDRGTSLALRDEFDLVPISEGDPVLENPYHVIIVRPEDRRPSNGEGARRFVQYLTSPGTRSMIEGFGKQRYGQPLFRPSETGR